MKVTFEGPTITDVAQQALMFSKAFGGETPSTPPPTKPVYVNGADKKRPGRPPNPNSKKGMQHRLMINEPVAEQIMVGPPGFEPGVSHNDTGLDNEQPVSHPPVKITKESLIDSINQLVKKENGGGIQAVRGIFEKFGVTRLGELDEKRYHELHKVLEVQLAL